MNGLDHQLLVFSVTPFKIDENKNQNHSIDKIQNLGNERRYICKDPRQDSGQRNISYTSRDMMAKCSSSKPEIGIHCNFGETTCFAVADAWKPSLIVSVISKTMERRAGGEIPPDTDMCKNIFDTPSSSSPFHTEQRHLHHTESECGSLVFH